MAVTAASVDDSSVNCALSFSFSSTRIASVFDSAASCVCSSASASWLPVSARLRNTWAMTNTISTKMTTIRSVLSTST